MEASDYMGLTHLGLAASIYSLEYIDSLSDLKLSLNSLISSKHYIMHSPCFDLKYFYLGIQKFLRLYMIRVRKSRGRISHMIRENISFFCFF